MRQRDPKELFDRACHGDRPSLARAISYIERGEKQGDEIASFAFRSHRNAYTVGITGAPGAGKSTLTSSIIEVIRGHGEEIGVIAIDPSSPFSGGAILGDRVRMQEHALDPGVYIRSMATRGHLGGLSVAVPEAARLLGAVGFPSVIIETVGVGQVEVEIAREADTTVVVVNPGWGDAVQANKAGLMEIADVFIINKADRPGVRETRRDLEGMLDLSNLGDYRPPIVETVAADKKGCEEAWDAICSHRDYAKRSGLTDKRRSTRTRNELSRILEAMISNKVDLLLKNKGTLEMLESMDAGTIDPRTLANLLLAAVT
ncbi:methylmalonyl Co-A mutase-associated GTPase MeaB [Acidithrix sp. C25]|uniref:methylmalonyl Co-A mutase-associated GTPase MeaB n=1 Tax=Acidithrix sp. C25 TaxID=1671482 RepID=UPI00191BA037|nr:methylmalonyl Co-A mutase-associated GTPase MeaB [Acidithrix sp. C25]CAG4929219.1 unnamed protein product [Acidithrix sp. C25]